MAIALAFAALFHKSMRRIGASQQLIVLCNKIFVFSRRAAHFQEFSKARDDCLSGSATPTPGKGWSTNRPGRI
jgi:hypothetical protein